MQTVVIEGTFEDVRKRVNTLLLPLDAPITVTVRLNGADECNSNGATHSIAPLLPCRDVPQPITTDYVRQLIEEMDDEEALRHYAPRR